MKTKTVVLGLSAVLAASGVGLCVQPQEAQALAKPSVNQAAANTNVSKYEHINTFNQQGDIKQLSGHVASIETHMPTDNMIGVGDDVRLNFTIKFTGLKPNSSVNGILGYSKMDIPVGYALDGNVGFNGVTNAQDELTTTAVARFMAVGASNSPVGGFVAHDIHVRDIDCWLKKDNPTNDKLPKQEADAHLAVNCDVTKKANGKYRLSYTLPSSNPSFDARLLPDRQVHNWFHLPNGEGASSSAKDTYSDNVNFVQGDNPVHASLFDAATNKPINTQSMRFVAILQAGGKDILANETTTKNILPEKVIFDDVDVKDAEISKLDFVYAVGTDGYAAASYKPTVINRFHNEEAKQTDDISSELETLLNEHNDIEKTDNYKNADDNLKHTYDTAVTDGQKVYDKLSSTPEQVKQAVEKIKTALGALNGDKKAQAIKEQLSTATQKIASLQSDLEKAKQQNTTDKSKIDELTGKISTLNGQLEQLKQDNTKSIEEKQKEIAKLNSQIEDLNKQVAQLTKDKGSLQQQLDTANGKVQTLTEQLKQDKTKSDKEKQAEIDKFNGNVGVLAGMLCVLVAIFKRRTL